MGRNNHFLLRFKKFLFFFFATPLKLFFKKWIFFAINSTKRGSLSLPAHQPLTHTHIRVFIPRSRVAFEMNQNVFFVYKQWHWKYFGWYEILYVDDPCLPSHEPWFHQVLLLIASAVVTHSSEYRFIKILTGKSRSLIKCDGLLCRTDDVIRLFARRASQLLEFCFSLFIPQI